MSTNTFGTTGLSAEDLELLAYLLEEEGVDVLEQQTIFPRTQHERLPLSFAQTRLWFLDQFEPGTPAYNIPFALRLSGRLAVGVLQQSLNATVRRHEVLRTSFPTVDNQPIQTIARLEELPAVRLPLPVVDLRWLPEAARGPATQWLANQAAQRSFDLARGPLISATLLRLAEDAHVLLLTVHHIVFDGWSIGVFLQEVMTLYDAFVEGRPSPLPDLPIQYADFALWQREWLQGQVLEQQLAYWKQQLGGTFPVLQLPTDRPRPPLQTYRGSHCLLQLPLALSQALAAFSQREGATLFMTLLTAFNVLLHRYTGQDDIIVGSPIANRDFVEIERLIGFFVNTLLLRSDLSGDPPFRELLRRVREMTLEAYAHQNVPFEQLVDELRPERNLSHSSLFQVMFILQNAPLPSHQRPDLTMSALEVESGTAKFDLTLSMTETPASLQAYLEYNTDLFDQGTMIRLLDQYRTLLEGVIANPDQRLSRLPLLTEAERRQQLVGWNETAAVYPQNLCVHQLFEAAAARHPSRVALVFEDQHMTYGDLNRRANQLAHELRSLGVGPGVLVALSVERSPELIVALLGILKAGGAYVPLDPAYPRERLAFMLADSQAPLLLAATTDQRRPTNDRGQGDKETRRQADGDLATRYTITDQRPATNDRGQGDKGTRGQADGQAETQNSALKTQNSKLLLHPPSSVLDLCADWDVIDRWPAENLSSGVTPDNPAYVIYTSGSAGQPKGVQIPHRALVNYITTACDLFAIGPDDRCLQFASISFDTAAEEIYPCLCSGATLVLRTEALLSAAPTFLRACRELELTMLDLPTAYWHQLIAEIAAQELRLPQSLRLVIIGGEQALPDRAALWRQRAGDRVRLVNTYGPTEATIVTTSWALPGRSEADELPHAVPIGRPIRNTQVYMLNRQLDPVPIGVPGELCIGGVGLAHGYLRRPDLTAEKFVPNPFAAEDGGSRIEDGRSPSSILDLPSSRLYRTGDLARYRADGTIEFLGRVDQQIKIRGFRVELGEIEAVLEQHPTVREIAVVAREAPAGDTRLVAYIVPSNDQGPTTNDQQPVQSTDSLDSSFALRPWSFVGELRQWAQGRLPDYMIPSVLTLIDRLPLTPSGKVDRQALPTPRWTERRLHQVYVAPRTPVEAALAQLAGQVLGIEQIGIHDNFFALGGHSLLATQVVARVRELFHVELPLRAMFEAPTVAGMAERVETIRWTMQAADSLEEDYEVGEL